MNDGLLQIILDRLEADGLGPKIEALILAACEGDADLDGLLLGTAPEASTEREKARARAIPGVFLQDVRVEGFRGIGPEAALQPATGVGLTLVVGRNGSGKSSFAEALEMLLTGANQRWEERPTIWKNGWRNLHHEGPARITASFLVEGASAPLTISRAWTRDRGLDDGESWIELPGGECRRFDDPDWQQALADFRPFLSYNELGGMLTARPVDLYRALSAGLGLEEVEAACERLRQRRLAARNVLRSAQEQLAPLLARLGEAEDERAAACAAALGAAPWDLERVAAVLLGEEDGSAEEVSSLRRLSSFEVPAGEEISSIAAELRSAAAELKSIAGTPVERDLAVAELLDRALRFHTSHGDQPCPVCRQGALDDAWQARAVEERDGLRRRAARLEACRKRLEEARRRANALPSSFPPARPVEVEGVLTGAFEKAVEHWASKDSIADPAALADHLEQSGAALAEAAVQLRAAARRELDRRRAEWLPLARDLTHWLEAGRQAESVRESIAQLHSAENWIRDAADKLREERFRPIAEEAAELWRMLRQQSNVDLREIVLDGTGTYGKVELDVTVDGRPGVALGVMSQGELHSLALSLFFPRARRPESPFRFVVIDDPVQSMDPSRVDGLARVLELCSQDRQVLVFTHDARLAESVRRLQIPATILQVTRASDSRVSLESVQDPVARYLEDARALVCTADLPVKVKRRAVPNLCRHALEAACDEAVRRRRLARGESSIAVETLLESCHRLTERAALAFCDDIGQAGEVHHRLRNIGPWAVDCFNHCNRGSHELSEVELDRIVADTAKLAEKIRRAL